MLWNRLLTLGAGVGIEIRDGDLVVTLVKSGWRGVTVRGKTVLRDFRRRPASEWGEEYRAFLKGHDFRDLAATLVLPRDEVIIRLLELPAVAGAEWRSAVRYQLDSLHPYGEEEVYSSFAPLGRARAGAAAAAAGSHAVAVVIAARAVVERYADLFGEAGVKLAGVTVAAAAYHGAAKLAQDRGTPRAPFLVADCHDSKLEIYGESESRPFFSAAFDAATMPLEKAVAAAGSELRLPDDNDVPLVACGAAAAGASSAPAEKVFGSPLQWPPEFDLQRDLTTFAGALAGACRRWGWRTNLLPAARRSSSARWPLAATAATAACAVLVGLLLLLRGTIQDRRYAAAVEREIRQLEAVEKEVRALEQQAQKLRARRAQIESFRRRTESDASLVAEISRRLPPAVWLTSIEVGPEAVQLAGQAEAAAPLLGLLDSSGALTGAAFVGSIARAENRENFRIRAARRPAGSAPVAVAAAHNR